MAGTSIAKLAVMITGDESPLALSLNRGSAQMQKFQGDAVAMSGNAARGMGGLTAAARSASGAFGLLNGSIGSVGALAAGGAGLAGAALAIAGMVKLTAVATSHLDSMRQRMVDINKEYTSLTGKQGLALGADGKPMGDDDVLSKQWTEAKAAAGEFMATLLEVSGVYDGMIGMTRHLAETMQAWSHDLKLASDNMLGTGYLDRDAGMKQMLEEIKLAKAAAIEWDAFTEAWNANLDKMIDQQNEMAEASRRATEQMRNDADQLTKSLRTPAEIFADTISDLRVFAENGMIGMDTFARGIAKAQEDMASATNSRKDFVAQASVGAAERYTSAGYSAVNSARNEAQAINDFKAQEKAAAARAEAQRNRLIDAVKANHGQRPGRSNLT